MRRDLYRAAETKYLSGLRGQDSLLVSQLPLVILSSFFAMQPRSLSVMDLNGDKGYKINGEDESDHFGSALAVGDVNGDGYPGVLLDLALLFCAQSCFNLFFY